MGQSSNRTAGIDGLLAEIKQIPTAKLMAAYAKAEKQPACAWAKIDIKDTCVKPALKALELLDRAKTVSDEEDAFELAMMACRGIVAKLNRKEVVPPLIDAAPDLLWSLENLLDATRCFAWPEEYDKKSYLDTTHAAIAKAKAKGE
jgi:hypothetical protein